MPLRHSAFLTTRDAQRLRLHEPFGGSREIDVGYKILVEKPARNVIRFFIPCHIDISYDFPIDDTRFWRTWDVKISFAKLNFGDRLYFECPVSDTRCLKLVIYKGIICSKREFNSIRRAVDYAPPKAGEVEARARFLRQGGMKRCPSGYKTEMISRVAPLVGRDEAIDLRFKKLEHALEKKEKKRLWECLESSTTKGLDCGRGLVDTIYFDRMLSRSPDWLDAPSPSVRPVRATSPDYLTNYGEFDIRILISRGAFEAERMIGRSLVWPTSMMEGHAVRMFVRRREGVLPQVIMEIKAPDGSVLYQNIELRAQRDSLRPRQFLCPVEEERTDVLYFRSGFFASRRAHFLRYPPEGKAGVIQTLADSMPKLSPARRGHVPDDFNKGSTQYSK